MKHTQLQVHNKAVHGIQTFVNVTQLTAFLGSFASRLRWYHLEHFCDLTRNFLRKELPLKWQHPWWRHQMETFSALLAICAENSPVPGEFPAQRPVTRSFDVYFDLRPNRRLSKQSWGWWFETPSWPLWRHRNDYNSVVTWAPWRLNISGKATVQ